MQYVNKICYIDLHNGIELFLIFGSIYNNHCWEFYEYFSVSRPSNLYRAVRNIANIDRPSFIAELSSVLIC